MRAPGGKGPPSLSSRCHLRRFESPLSQLARREVLAPELRRRHEEAQVEQPQCAVVSRVASHQPPQPVPTRGSAQGPACQLPNLEQE